MIIICETKNELNNVISQFKLSDEFIDKLYNYFSIKEVISIHRVGVEFPIDSVSYCWDCRNCSTYVNSAEMCGRKYGNRIIPAKVFLRKSK